MLYSSPLACLVMPKSDKLHYKLTLMHAICTFACRVNPLVLILCTKCKVGFLHLFETLMLTGLLSVFEGGGLALLQSGGLGTTPTVHEYQRQST